MFRCVCRSYFNYISKFKCEEPKNTLLKPFPIPGLASERQGFASAPGRGRATSRELPRGEAEAAAGNTPSG